MAVITFIRYLKPVSPIDEPNVEEQYETTGIKEMPKDVMTYNEIIDMGPGEDHFILLPICTN